MIQHEPQLSQKVYNAAAPWLLIFQTIFTSEKAGLTPLGNQKAYCFFSNN